MSELSKILSSEDALAQAEAHFSQTKQAKEKLKQRRNRGKLIYNGWKGSNDWQRWRMQQLERQDWKCPYCGKKMKFGEKTYLTNGDFALDSQHPTVEHILPKALFPELALDPQNLVMVCWTCNKKKGSRMVSASRVRHEQLKKRLQFEA